MNLVILIGRLTHDPVLMGSESNAVCRFPIAIDRGKDKNGETLGTDYPNIVCFGKTAENVNKYMQKGRLVGIRGHIKTGSYEKEGRKVYTTEIVADAVEFLNDAPITYPNLHFRYANGVKSKETEVQNFEPAVDWYNGFDVGGDIPF